MQVYITNVRSGYKNQWNFEAKAVFVGLFRSLTQLTTQLDIIYRIPGVVETDWGLKSDKFACFQVTLSCFTSCIVTYQSLFIIRALYTHSFGSQCRTYKVTTLLLLLYMMKQYYFNTFFTKSNSNLPTYSTRLLAAILDIANPSTLNPAARDWCRAIEARLHMSKFPAAPSVGGVSLQLDNSYLPFYTIKLNILHLVESYDDRLTIPTEVSFLIYIFSRSCSNYQNCRCSISVFWPLNKTKFYRYQRK